MTDTTIYPAENTAETMRKVMDDLGKVEIINNPLGNTSPEHFYTDPFLVAVPNGKMIQDLSNNIKEAAETYQPIRRKGKATLCDLESLISWCNRFKSVDSALFATPSATTPKLTCIANYHSGGEETFDEGISDQSSHNDHQAVYEFPLSKEWLAWKGVSGRKLSKDEMGEFIEANAKDIQDPTPAIIALDRNMDGIQDWEKRLIDTAAQIEGRYGQLAQLLSMSRQFAVHESSDLTLTSNRDTGEQSIQFKSEHRDADGAPIKIPNLIIITIPVFEGGAAYRMPVRFRYTKSGGSLGFTLTVYNPEKAFDDAFKGGARQAASETDLPLFIGSPEA